MISNLMRPRVHGSSAIRRMFEEGKKLASVYGPENVYDFSLGNPNVPAPEELRDAMIDILKTEDPLKLHGYMSNAGFDETRRAIAEDLNSRYGTSYSAANVVMTAGAASAMNITMRSILEPGDEVIVFAPYFLEYNNYLSNYGAVPVVIAPHPESGFMPDVKEMCDRITPKTKAVIVNNPNNPTGAVYPAEVITKLAEALRSKQEELGTVIYIISDEPYRELVYGDAKVPHIPDFYDNTLICYSYSKSLSLPGERIGYVLVPSQSDGWEEFVLALSTANRMLGIVNAPSLQQLAIARATGLRSNVAFYEKNSADLYDGLSSMGFNCVKPDGAFYLWVKSPVPDDAAFCDELKEERILATPGSAFMGPGYFRLSYCVSHETVVNSMPSFRRVAERYFG